MGITLISKENTRPGAHQRLVLQPYLLRGWHFPGTQVSPLTEHSYKEFPEQKAAKARLCAAGRSPRVTNATSGCPCPCPQKFTSLYRPANQNALFVLWLGVHTQPEPRFQSLTHGSSRGCDHRVSCILAGIWRNPVNWCYMQELEKSNEPSVQQVPKYTIRTMMQQLPSAASPHPLSLPVGNYGKKRWDATATPPWQVHRTQETFTSGME